MREVLFDLLWMHYSPLSNEIQQQLRLFPSWLRPRQTVLGRNPAIRLRMHQPTKLSRHKSVVDEEIFLDTKLGVPPLQVPGTVILHSMAQHKILCPRWCANRIRLHKPHPLQGTFQRRGTEQALRHSEPPQIIESDTHLEILPNLQDCNCPRTALRSTIS